VQESIDALSGHKADGLAGQKITIVIIAHRLSTIRNADRIFVLERGNLVEQGTHNHLMTLDQRYADLVRLQATEKTSDSGVSAPSSPSKEAVSSALVAKTDLPHEQTSDSKASHQPVATTEKSDKQEEDSKESNADTIRRIRSMILDHVGFLLIGLTGAAIFGGIFPAWGYMIAKAVSSFYLPDPDEIRDEAAFNAFIFILLSGVSFFSAIAQYYGIVGLGERISCRFRSDLFQALLRNHIGFFDHPDNSIGNLTTMLAEDTRLLHKAFGEGLAKQIMAVSTLIVGLVIAFIASWKISLVVLATFPLNIIASGIQMQAFQGQQ
jgi:ATP-binding cassette subfamily B (MDR/TAP) protein 1